MIRRRSIINKLLLIALLSATGILFSYVHLSAQDTVAQGTIKVRRGPVPSEYRVEVSYDYHWKKPPPVFHFLDFQRAPAIFLPPDPIIYEPNANDSSRTQEDSAFVVGFYNRLGRPVEQEDFDWAQWISTYYVHSFGWDDTAGIDSVTYVIGINARGDAEVYSESIVNGDTSAVRLQKNLDPVMDRLWAWYPAACIDSDGKKPKKIPCTVRLKVYAVKADEQDLKGF